MSSKKSVAAPDTSEREIVITRVIDAPRERVWKAFADPEQVVKWWGPNGFSDRTQERSFKKGGTWKHTMIGPDGAEYQNLARFEEIVEPERIVYTNGGGRKDGPGVSFRQTWLFKDLGGKTELTLRLVFGTKQERDFVVKEFGAIEGGRQTLAKLAAHLDGSFRLSRLVAAPRATVWKAWTEPERLAQWFGPKGLKTLSVKLELKPGGVYHYGLKTPDGKEMWGKWTFREILAPERLVFVNSFSNARAGVTRHPLSATWPLEMLSTIELSDFGPKTLITLTWAPLNATEAERKTFSDGRASMTQGWGGTFEQLDAYLAQAGGK